MTFKEFIDKKLKGKDITKIKKLEIQDFLSPYTLSDLYGLEEFTELQTFVVTNQEISELPNLPPKIKTLEVGNNRIFKFSFKEFPKTLRHRNGKEYTRPD